MSPDVRRARIRSDVNIAGSVLARSWPLETFIAINPLGGLEDLEFGEAIRKAGDLFGARGTLDERLFREAHERGRVTDDGLLHAVAKRVPSILDRADVELGGTAFPVSKLLLCDMIHGEPCPPPARVNRMVSESHDSNVALQIDNQCSAWCAAFLDESQAGWTMPGRSDGFYLAWRDLAWRDRTLPKAARKALRNLPESPEDSIFEALSLLGIGEGDRREYLQAHLTRLPGWAAHIRWRAGREGGLDLVDFLAMRLSYESALLTDTTPASRSNGDAQISPLPATPDERADRVASVLGVRPDSTPVELTELSKLLSALSLDERGLIWLDAYEANYRDPLVAGLNESPAADRDRPLSQLVCCIDARSEGLRRHYEATGPHETLGFAGFFAVAIRFQDLAGGRHSELCPVLLEPRNEIIEMPGDGDGGLASRRVEGLNSIAAAQDSFHSAESHLASPFVLAETTGWVAGPLSAARTFTARGFGSARRKLASELAPSAPTVLDVNSGFTLEERLLFGEAALTMMGLVDGFAQIVVLCGHGSTTENNPYDSALDCGACGGSPGGANARTATAILNQPEIRQGLASRGIEIPDDTVFIPAQHDTTTDRVELLDPHLVPSGLDSEIEQIQRDLKEAGARLTAERCQIMPGAPAGVSQAATTRHVEGRSSDWAQVFPEWGLAGNAAFVVGPRQMTRGLNLERRTFLHSYEAAVDPEGSALETILTAPLVVAQWINCQYYFSTVDQFAFGAGSKTIHNVVGSFGVLAGPGGDLQMGLPWQSLSDGEKLIHEPMRLLAVVQAPLERIDLLIDRNTILQQLFGNGWLGLVARDDFDNPWMRHTADGWQPWAQTEGSEL